MNGENINIDAKPLRVLLSPLDWGLGHATRIITIVKILQNYDVSVLIAADGAIASLLKTEFPGVEILQLPGYRVRYSRKKNFLFFKLLGQFPRISALIRKENDWLKAVVEEQKIDAVISDNRFGFYHTGVPCVYITHQLFIETGLRWLNAMAQKIHYKYINHFNECWVPDFKAGITLAGKLSHPKKLPAIPVKYLGPLSRFKKTTVSVTNDLLIVLSGPEPQRSIWEQSLLGQIKNIDLKIVLVRGLPNETNNIIAAPNVKIFNHLPAEVLNELVLSSAIVLSRSGYSTIMDLVALGKKAILVPTPGQAEQEYLADHLKYQQLFYTCSQQELNLETAIDTAMQWVQKKTAADFELANEQVIKEWIRSLQASK